MLRSITLGIVLILAALSFTPKSTPYHKLSQSVVTVTHGGGGGTGFLTKGVSGTTYVITNEHVCGNRDTMVVQRTGDQISYNVPVIKRDAKVDLCALMQVPGEILSIGKEPVRFTEQYVLGHPLLYPQRAVKGIYNGEERVSIAGPKPKQGCNEGEREVDSFFFGTFCLHEMILGQTSIPIYPGNSGSPITDENGDLQGVINSGDQTNNGGFVPLRDLVEFLSTL